MSEQELLTIIEQAMPFSGTATLDSNLFDDLGYDSAVLLDLVFQLEQRLTHPITADDLSMDNLSTPRSILGLIEKSAARKN